MPLYTYTAEAAPGEAVRDTASAEDLPDLGRRLADMGLALKSAAPARRGAGFGKIPLLTLAAVYRQLANSLAGGLPLADTLRLTSLECANPRLRRLLSSVYMTVASGCSLAEAMSEFPNSFPPIYVELVRAGEQAGALDRTLAQIADHAEQTATLNRKVASALVYPAVVGSVALMVLFMIVVVIAPRFATLYSDLGIREFPLPTRAVLAVSRTAPSVVLFLFGFAAVCLIFRRAAGERMSGVADWLKARTPVVRDLMERRSAAGVLSTLSVLLSTGAPLVESMKLAARAAGSRAMAAAMALAAARVASGERLGQAVEREGVLPATAAWQIGVAEEDGTLPETLASSAAMYQGMAEQLAAEISGFIEPLLILTLGVVVGLVVVSLFLPIVAIVSLLTGADAGA